MPTADILRRAADVLDEAADKAAPAPWEAVGEYLAAPVDGCTCGSPLGEYPHEPGCGSEPFGQTDAQSARYIALVDSTVGKALAVWLRNVADTHDETPCPAHTAAVAVARALIREADDAHQS